VQAGDRLIALPSAGLHTNGYSLARKIFFEVEGLSVGDRVEELGTTVGQSLLAEHRCYLEALRVPIERGLVHGLAHITGGGIPDNLPRVLPEGTAARVNRDSWPVPPLFSFLQRAGRVEQTEMDRVFNMGVGMVVIVAPDDVEAFVTELDRAGETHHAIGEIVAGQGGVLYV
jgi:phosphoribosylformylglycinamidine cyclo-ligase